MKKFLFLVALAACLTAFLISCKEEEKKAAVSQKTESKPAAEKKAVETEAGAEDEYDGPWFMAQTEKAPVSSVSATSELVETKFAGRYIYPPINILDGDFENTWCESVDGDGIGEAVTVEFSEPVSFDEIQIVNGFATDESWEINNRIKTVQITQVAGEHFQRKDYELLDGVMDWQSIKFALPQTAQTIEFKIVDVYKGTKYQDSCLDDVRLLYKGNVIPFTGVAELKKVQEENSRAMLNSDFDQKFKALFKPSSLKDDGFKYLILEEKERNGMVLCAKEEGKTFSLVSMDPAAIYPDDDEIEYVRNIKENVISGFDYYCDVYDGFNTPDYTIGNCRIIIKSKISYIDTTTVKLIRIDGNKVIINGVPYKVIPSEKAYLQYNLR